ncbi:alpha/beta hydrolase fold domain-containing protein [Piscinibacter sakaiensis]|uniref:Esterase/lipase n=1 Tax=Piscinibacter sakaiensis TaxID=1547922 RepID=A0A0K8P2M0_PISS1|nr:alpha/beta hydrolase fold domain-containing protein [Piscinibacter sakaiensis]GAP36863.1 esterase/lipase [Piscinibacter sakaiensis]
MPEPHFEDGRIGAFDARTAPIFLPSAVGGYMPALPGTLVDRMPPALGRAAVPSASAVALSRGFVVAAPGARGRTLQAADGRWTGKAPAAIVDLKAAVRWLRHNVGRLPGNAERIISNGASAGGALSALLGATAASTSTAAERPPSVG